MKNKFYLNDFEKYIKSNSLFTNFFVILCYVLSAVIILFFNYFIDAFFSFNPNNYKVGEPAKSSYVLKSNLYYYNDFETKLARDIKEKLVLPVYKVDDEITQRTISNYESFASIFLKLSSSESDFNIIKEQVNALLPDVLTDEDIENILKLDAGQLFSHTGVELKKLMNRGVISSDITRPNNGSGLINIISLDENNNLIENISALSVAKSIDFTPYENIDINRYIEKILNAFIVVNCFYDNVQTKFNKKTILDEVEPVIDLYRKGDTLVKEGFVVSNEDFKKISQAEESVKGNTFSSIFLVLGYLLLLFLASFVLFTKSFILKKLDETEVILIAGFTLFFTISAVLVNYFLPADISFLLPLVIPSVLIAILTTFLLGNRVSLYLSVLLSFLVLLISGFSMYTFIVTLIMSLLGTIVVHDVEKRIGLLKSSGELVVLQTLLTLYLTSVGLVKINNIPLLILVSISSAIVSGILTLALLPLSEHFLKISTCFQLAELCDLNTPVLKSMLVKAPGTYAHSIAVANMSESAAQHIGANALLAKAGGYYHDIGKIDQPHYFIENQKGGKNLHDEMKPSLSVAVIKSHVKLGIEKGKTIGLPGDIIDIIEQHHGKGVIAFFLDKAKKESKGTPVLNEDFSYGGPNPQNPESAIVMLADSVEAAVRSLKNPTISQLDKFVWDLILNKLKEGMLDACGLTLSDLTTIKNAFINTLMGHYHSRIEYPAGEDE